MPRKKEKPKPKAILPTPLPTLEERFETFLTKLAESGDVKKALEHVKLTLNAVTYRRKKDPDFDAGWELAMERAGRAKDHLVFLDVYAKTGNQTEALRLANWTRADLRARKISDPAFAEAVDDARLVAGDSLEAEARRRAVAGVRKPLIHGGRIVYHQNAKGEYITDELGAPIPVEEIEYSDRLLETLLKANMPEKFRENVKVDHAVSGGVLLLSAKAPSEDEWEKRMEQKRLGQATKNAGRIIEHGAS